MHGNTMGIEKLWVSVILKFLDDLYPPVRVFDVSPISVGDHYYRVRSVDGTLVDVFVCTNYQDFKPISAYHTLYRVISHVFKMHNEERCITKKDAQSIEVFTKRKILRMCN